MNSQLFLLAAIAAVAAVGPSQAHDANKRSPAQPLEIDMSINTAPPTTTRK
jgi:hypothetical protein